MTKRNHVVPRKYLWWFRIPDPSESSTGKVWMYDRVSRKWTNVPVHNAGVIKNFYQGEDEVGLADQVEGPALRPMEKLHGGHQIDFEERLKVAWYAYAMLARVPRAREVAKRILVEDSELMVKQTIEAAREAYRVAEIPVPERIEEIFREMVDDIEADPSALPDDLYDEMVQRVWYSSETGSVPEIAKILANFAWRVVFSGEKQKFITSDNPVHVFPLS